MPRHDPDQKTKQEILKTASRLFLERGFENVSIEDVVTEVNLTRGAFYHYFKSREDLFINVKTLDFNENNPFALVKEKKELNALEKLLYVLKSDVRQRLKSDDSLKIELKKLSNNSIVTKNVMQTQVNVVAPHIEMLLVEGNQDGSTSVQYPKQTAQIISLLVSTWLNPYIFKVSFKEYEDKISNLEQLGEQLGVPFIDQEMKEMLLQIGHNELDIKD